LAVSGRVGEEVEWVDGWRVGGWLVLGLSGENGANWMMVVIE